MTTFPPPDPLDAKYKPAVRIAELPATTTIEELVGVLDRDGGVILTNFMTQAQLDQVDKDTASDINAKTTESGGYGIIPKETRVLNGLVGKSPTIAALCEHPHLNELRKRILTDDGDKPQEEVCYKYHVDPLLSVSLSFRIGPGAPRQRLHRDDFIHLPNHDLPYELNKVTQFAVLIAACDTTQENGATMFVPGSHRWDSKRKPKLDEVTFAEMKRGDALIFLAGCYHGGGHNSVPDFTRVVHGLFFCRGTLRTEENQFLAIPRSKAMKMSPTMQALLGYKKPQQMSLGLLEGDDPMKDLEASLAYASA